MCAELRRACPAAPSGCSADMDTDMRRAPAPAAVTEPAGACWVIKNAWLPSPTGAAAAAVVVLSACGLLALCFESPVVSVSLLAALAACAAAAAEAF